MNTVAKRSAGPASGVMTRPLTPVDGNPEKLINPSDYEGEEVVFGYLKDTPFLRLFDVPVPVAIDEELRFSHTWVLAPPKTGKTQLIQWLVSHDLPKVARGEASVVVMDSQGDLINNLANLHIGISIR